MFEHKSFCISSLISFILIVIIGTLYNYYDGLIRLILKPFPILILIGNIIAYFIIYRINIYSLLTLIVLIFCMTGDILIMFNSPILLIVGSVSFFIARVIICVIFYVHPYSFERTVTPGIKKLTLSGLISFLYTVSCIVGISLILNDFSLIILIDIYILVMGCQLFFSLLRIGEFEETFSCQIFGIVSTICFNISDTLLFLDMFFKIQKYYDMISICFYWLSSFLLAMSVVRNKTFDLEKRDSY